MVSFRGDHFRFGFYQKKVTKPIFFKTPKANRNRFKPTDFGSVWFFRTKTGSNRFGSVFSVWLGFGSVLAWFWLGLGSVLARFFSVWLGLG